MPLRGRIPCDWGFAPALEDQRLVQVVRSHGDYGDDGDREDGAHYPVEGGGCEGREEHPQRMDARRAAHDARP